MSIYHPYNVACNCGNEMTVHLARSVNAVRSPEIKQKIIDGEFHKCCCTACGLTVNVEKEFSYIDFDTNTFMKVKPRQERYFWKQASEAFLTELKKIPAALADKARMHTRVVFGLAELREKIIAADHKLDDRLLEVLKVLLIYDHPVLTDKPRLKISLDKIDPEAISFTADYELDNKKKFRLSLPRSVVDPFIRNPQKAVDWVKQSHKLSNIYSLKNDAWISMQRWSPRVTAIDSLRQFALTILDGNDIDTSSKKFKNMLAYLPAGSTIPSDSKKDIKILFDYARKKGLPWIEKALFDIRFDKKLKDEWALNNDPDDIDTIYKLLSHLPQTNVEGNVFINEIGLDSKMSSKGKYETSTKDIYISSTLLRQQEDFEDTILHEIGHAVYFLYQSKIDPWLKARFGWQAFTTEPESVNKWVNLMGGWGDIDKKEKKQIIGYLKDALGEGNRMYPGRLPKIPADHSWNKQDFGPRKAYDLSPDNWYSYFAHWHTAGDYAFFLNYWYKKFYAVAKTTIDLIAKMPDSYAAMSDLEFFAELYSVYYDTTNSKRGDLPSDVCEWLDKNIGKLNTPNPQIPEATVNGHFIWPDH